MQQIPSWCIIVTLISCILAILNTSKPLTYDVGSPQIQLPQMVLLQSVNLQLLRLLRLVNLAALTIEQCWCRNGTGGE